MRTLSFVILFAGATSLCNAQWYWQNPLPQGNPLYSVCFTDANTGTAVGSSGTILRTTNGGVMWISQTSGTTNWLRGVSFTDANTGTAIGDGGAIVRTTNGGATWTLQTSGTTRTLYGVSFTDANTGAAVGEGGTILRTSNGGTTFVEPIGSRGVPNQYVLQQNYPNPFNPTTNISFNLPADAFVSVKVYNMLGQEVATLADREEFTEGENEIEFNAQNLSSGVYFYRIVVNDGQFQQVKKMMLLK